MSRVDFYNVIKFLQYSNSAARIRFILYEVTAVKAVVASLLSASLLMCHAIWAARHGKEQARKENTRRTSEVQNHMEKKRGCEQL